MPGIGLPDESVKNLVAREKVKRLSRKFHRFSAVSVAGCIFSLTIYHPAYKLYKGTEFTNLFPMRLLTWVEVLENVYAILADMILFDKGIVDEQAEEIYALCFDTPLWNGWLESEFSRDALHILCDWIIDQGREDLAEVLRK